MYSIEFTSVKTVRSRSLLLTRYSFVFITVMILTGFLTSVSAQDIIKLKSGREIKASILEENNDNVKYREFENPSGPVFTVKKDLVESVKYKKVAKNQADNKKVETVSENKQELNVQDGQPKPLTVKKRYVLLDGKVQSPRTVKELMDEYPEALKLYEKGIKNTGLSTTLLFTGTLTACTFGIISAGKHDPAESRKYAAIGLGIDLAAFAGAIYTVFKGKKCIRESVELYNSAIGKPVSYKIDFGIQKSGVGFALKF